jgi:hypothetical protein
MDIQKNASKNIYFAIITTQQLHSMPTDYPEPTATNNSTTYSATFDAHHLMTWQSRSS